MSKKKNNDMKIVGLVIFIICLLVAHVIHLEEHSDAQDNEKQYQQFRNRFIQEMQGSR